MSTACFSNVTVLAMCPEHLDVLFQHPHPLPALTSFSVRVALVDLNSKGIVPLMRKIIGRLRQSHKSLPLSLDVRANISPEAVMCRMLDNALGHGLEWDEGFGSFQHLRVRGYGPHSRVILAQWVGIFCGATEICLEGMSGSQASQRRTVAEIQRICSNVRTVTVEGLDTLPVETGMKFFGGKGRFLELPDDVLLEIFDQLGSAELYGLSRLSRRLNLLSFPLYLTRRAIPDPRHLCEFELENYPIPGDNLSLLNSALFLREVKHISCQFKPGGYIFCYLHHIERLATFLSKFPSIQTVSLTLVDLPVQGTRNIDSEVNETVRTKWRVAFGNLLNVILERSCNELTICGPPYLNPGLSEPPWPTPQAAVHLSPAAQTNSSALHSFSFHPTTDVSHSGILWTFSSLRSSHLTRLSITAFSSSLLDVIAQELPNLLEFDVTSCPDDVGLLRLLCRLPCLIYLALPGKGTVATLRPRIINSDIPELLCLRTLAAPSSLIMFFFRAVAPLPALERLEIRASAISSPAHMMSSIATVLLALGERRLNVLKVPSVVALDITMVHWRAEQLIAWLNAGGLQKLVDTESFQWADTVTRINGAWVELWRPARPA
ncbi:hypothetical protein K438DRAFT_701164 [Mycena galopus ATCC 62051]|nr:hypothetical protein K438DRAFT_701164 [Mycena galopus ATCC 62051]